MYFFSTLYRVFFLFFVGTLGILGYVFALSNEDVSDIAVSYPDLAQTQSGTNVMDDMDVEERVVVSSGVVSSGVVDQSSTLEAGFFPLILPTEEMLLEEALEKDVQHAQAPINDNAIIAHELVPLDLPLVGTAHEDEQQQDVVESQTEDELLGVDEQADTLSGEALLGEEETPLEIIWPERDIVYSAEGLPLVDSVQGVVVTGPVPYCSMMSRFNLRQFYPNRQEIAGLGGLEYISRGNAIDLIEHGIAYGELTRIPSGLLHDVLDHTNNVAHDIYIYTSDQEVRRALESGDVELIEEVYDQYLLQGHRAVVFQGDDRQRYVLDTLRGAQTSDPQLLATYMQDPLVRNGEIYLLTDAVRASVRDVTGNDDLRAQIEQKKYLFGLLGDERSFSEMRPYCEEMKRFVLPERLPLG